MKAKQILSAETFGIINFENGMLRSVSQSNDIMNMLAGREIGKTPKNEATSLEIMNAWYKGWDKAKRIMMKEKFGF